MIIRDSNECFIELTGIEITEPDELTANAIVSEFNCEYNVSCHNVSDGEIDITVEGGCEPYTYAWTADFDGDGINDFTSSDEDLINLSGSEEGDRGKRVALSVRQVPHGDEVDV